MSLCSVARPSSLRRSAWGAELAAAGVGDGFDVGQARRVDEHHVGAVGRERLAADRAGEDAREVEHAHAAQGALVCAQHGQRQRRGVADALDGEQRLRRQGLRLRRGVPFVETAQRGDDEALRRSGVFEIARLPLRHARFGIGARGGRGVELHQAQRAVAVMREVRMHAHPAVGALVEARELVPDIGHVPVEAEPARAFERRVQHVDRHVLPRHAALVRQLAGRERGGGDGALRRRADRERRGQHGIGAAQFRKGQGLIGQARLPPDRGQNFIRIHLRSPMKKAGPARAALLPVCRKACGLTGSAWRRSWPAACRSSRPVPARRPSGLRAPRPSRRGR